VQANNPAEAQTSVLTYPQVHIGADPQTAERLKRLSIDMPVGLHRRFKVACAATDRIMVEEVLGFIERRTAELEQSK
jgi:hypothetical protein